MAKATNLLTTGLSGKLGGTLVFRKGNGQTIVSASPQKGSQEPSEKQTAQRDRFRKASFYAQRVSANSTLFEEYSEVAARKGYQNVRSLIIQDYFRLPEIQSCDVVRNSSSSGAQIEVIVTDLMRVDSVTLEIRTPDKAVVGKGNAVMGADKQTWTFQVQDASLVASGNSIRITATDLPGNVVNRNFVL